MNKFPRIKLTTGKFWPVNSEKGAIALLTSFFVMMIILLIALAVGTIMALEVRMSREIGNSIPAFYAADAGAEQCLYEARKGAGGFCNSIGDSIDCSLVNNCFLDNGAKIDSATRSNAKQIDSSGSFNGTKRKVEINWQ